MSTSTILKKLKESNKILKEIIKNNNKLQDKLDKPKEHLKEETLQEKNSRLP